MTGPAAVPAEPPPVPELRRDPAAIRTFATGLLAASAQVDDLGSFVAGAARAPTWAGAAATAYRSSIRQTGATADADSLALRHVAQRCDAHADAVEALRRRRDDLAAERATLCHRLDELHERAGRAVAAGPVAVDVWEAEVTAWRRRAADFEGELARWRADVLAEDTGLRDVLVRATDVAAAEARQVGRPDPADRALATRPRTHAGPDAVAAWWSGLSGEEQRAVIAASPGVIGNLGGIPAWARDAANTVALARDLARLRLQARRGDLGEGAARRLANATAARDALDLVAVEADPVTGRPLGAQLYSFAPAAFGGDGAVCVAVGDVGTASDVAVVVPGLGTDALSAPHQAERAVDLQDAATSLGQGASVATLAWIGYDAPSYDDPRDAAGVLGEQMAVAGGARLAGLADGLRAAAQGAPAHLTVIGHSYGSTTLGHAAHDHGVAADDLVLVGSPGAGGEAHHAVDLGIDPRHVWVGADSRDPVARLGDDGLLDLGTLHGGGLGTNPASDDFGATRFRAETVGRPGAVLSPGGFAEHGRYFEPGTESLFDIAQIVDAHYDAVLPADPVTDPWWGPPQDPEWGRAPAPAWTGP